MESRSRKVNVNISEILSPPGIMHRKGNVVVLALTIKGRERRPKLVTKHESQTNIGEAM
jgi:hypothetical protein